MEKILLIDDQEDFCKQVQKSLQLHNIGLNYVTSSRRGLDLALNEDWDVLLLDVVLNQKLDGLGVLKKIVERNRQLPIIMISGSSTLHTAVEATQMGAYDFLEKPLDLNRLLVTIRRALRNKQLTSLNRFLMSEINKQIRFIGQSPAIERIFDEIERVAKSHAKIFIHGESGVGKDLLAKIIHYQSRRSAAPFVSINCGALPEALIESELFGYEQGAFTGANEKKLGLIAQAEGGTLFLNEIAELPVTSQAKLLRFLNDGRYSRVGGAETITSDVRIIAATNRDIQTEIEEGRFRQDLFFRLNVVNLYLPPLRERKEDIPLLAEFFLHQACENFGKNIPHFSESSLELLKSCHWRGNVRQLKSAIERMVLFSSNHIIDYGTAATAIQMDRTNEMVISGDSYRQALEEFERLYFLNLLNINQWDLERTARSAQMNPHILKQKLTELKIKKPKTTET